MGQKFKDIDVKNRTTHYFFDDIILVKSLDPDKIILYYYIIILLYIIMLLYKYMKIKFNSDDDLPLDNMLELCNMVIIIRSAFK